MANRLRQYIEHESAAMLRTLRYYLSRVGVSSANRETAADELWQDVVVEALRSESRLPSQVQPRAWLLGIAANLIKRRQRDLARRERREPLARDLFPDDTWSDDDLFDWISEKSSATYQIEDDDEWQAWLKELAPDDQTVIRLAIVHSLDGDALAKTLGVSPGAARVRLHRALGRLRKQTVARADAGGG
jgi:RNA polymerase sigma-70 factor (ECF subfamily)